jgi:sRNA-binding carbon storage regulator CsrA
MLTLTRKVGQSTYLILPTGERIEVVLNRINGHQQASISFGTPASVLVVREEILADLTGRGIEPTNPEELRAAMVRLRAARTPA